MSAKDAIVKRILLNVNNLLRTTAAFPPFLSGTGIKPIRCVTSLMISQQKFIMAPVMKRNS